MGGHSLLHHLIDYAGVFPPAEHSVLEAARRYRQARSGPDGWILGPFLLRAGQLPDHEPDDIPLPLGVVLDVPLDQLDGRFQISQVEMKVTPGRVAERAGPVAAAGRVVYVEADEAGRWDYIDEIASLRAQGHDVRAKLRTGGASAEVFPDVDSVVDLIIRCHRAAVPFKATAGLHHPFRHPSVVPGATEHGFVNLLAAVRAVVAGEPEAARGALAATDPAEFDLGAAAWRGAGARVDAAEVRALFRSFGSCSFQEPAGYLHSLGLLLAVTP